MRYDAVLAVFIHRFHYKQLTFARGKSTASVHHWFGTSAIKIILDGQFGRSFAIKHDLGLRLWILGRACFAVSHEPGGTTTRVAGKIAWILGSDTDGLLRTFTARTRIRWATEMGAAFFTFDRMTGLGATSMR
jgi:hypothetical protein